MFSASQVEIYPVGKFLTNVNSLSTRRIFQFCFDYLVWYSPLFFITQAILAIQFGNTCFSTIFGVSEKMCPLAQIRSSLRVNNAPWSFVPDNERRRSPWCEVWAIRWIRHYFGVSGLNLFWIKSRILSRCIVKVDENIIQCYSAAGWADVLLDVWNSVSTELLRIVSHTFR
jgi:hypothetical protein